MFGWVVAVAPIGVKEVAAVDVRERCAGARSLRVRGFSGKKYNR
jgi:hypothetical protein